MIENDTEDGENNQLMIVRTPVKINSENKLKTVMDVHMKTMKRMIIIIEVYV